MTDPVELGFNLAAPSEDAARAIAVSAAARGFQTEVDVERGQWSTYCRRTMLPDDISSAQAELDAVAREHGGYLEYWNKPA